MHAHTTDGWGQLFLAEAGASAALAGLLFVAISINLTKILEVRGLAAGLERRSCCWLPCWSSPRWCWYPTSPASRSAPSCW
jgi:hypothetical protein